MKRKNTRSYHGFKLKNSHWTQEEDKMIMDFVKENKHTDFKTIDVCKFQNKTIREISLHWKCVLDPRIKKGSWTQEEDEIILKWVLKNGKKSWKELETCFNTCRNRKQLRERYSVLNNNKKKWNEEEDNIVIEMVKRYGCKWSLIGEKINREQNQVKNRWHSTIKKRLERLKCGKEPILKRGRKKKTDFFYGFDFSAIVNDEFNEFYF